MKLLFSRKTAYIVLGLWLLTLLIFGFLLIFSLQGLGKNMGEFSISTLAVLALADVFISVSTFVYLLFYLFAFTQLKWLKISTLILLITFFVLFVMI